MVTSQQHLEVMMNALPASGLWTADLSSTTASFEAANFIVSRVPGTIAVRSGEVLTDPQGRPTSVTAVLDPRSIATGNACRDKDLRSRRFFDVEEHPEMRFTSASITAGDDGVWSVEGTLYVGANEAPMNLAVVLRRDPSANTVRVTARGSIDRAAAGIKAPGFVIGRQVSVTVEAVLSPSPARVPA